MIPGKSIQHPFISGNIPSGLFPHCTQTPPQKGSFCQVHFLFAQRDASPSLFYNNASGSRGRIEQNFSSPVVSRSAVKYPDLLAGMSWNPLVLRRQLHVVAVNLPKHRIPAPWNHQHRILKGRPLPGCTSHPPVSHRGNPAGNYCNTTVSPGSFCL